MDSYFILSKYCKRLITFSCFIFFILTVFHVSLLYQNSKKDTSIVSQILDVSQVINTINTVRILGGNNKPKCEDFLTAIKHGHWKSFPPNKEELKEVEDHLHEHRTQFLKLPKTFERPDKKCGTVTLGAVRALCDPRGPAPCCMGTTCVSRDKENCTCETCFDLRNEMHAEFADYVLESSACQLRRFTQADVCSLLNGVTIHFIGDSLVRQFYVATLAAVRGGLENVFKDAASRAERTKCRGSRIFVHSCGYLLNNTCNRECSNTADVQLHELWKAAQTLEMQKIIKTLIGKPRSFLVLGVGLHNGCNANVINKEILEPIVKMKGKNSWPVILFATPHSPGVLKSPRHGHQSRATIRKYIAAMTPVLRGHSIPLMDTFHLSEGVVSYDGTHFSLGMNRVKAQILFQWISHLKGSAQWTKS